MDDPLGHDFGGRPGKARERAGHAQEIARYEQLVDAVRAEHDPFRKQKARARAALFKAYGTLFVMPKQHNSVCKAGDHVAQYTFEPAKCAKCGAWGVKRAQQNDGTFGKQCCNHGKVDACHLPRNELDDLLMLPDAEFAEQDAMKLRVVEMLLCSGNAPSENYSTDLLRTIRARMRDYGYTLDGRYPAVADLAVQPRCRAQIV